MNQTTYILGHDDAELRRLELQARVLEPLTERLLHDVGLAEGATVLDIGTGVGDVALLAGTRVGPRGRVLGIDRNDAAIGRARDRAARAELGWIEFAAKDFGDGAALGSFDLVIGRFVLMHQSDPVAFVRRAASQVRPGGVLAFVEMAQSWQAHYSVPPVPPFDDALNEVLAAFGTAHADLDVGSRLTAVFAAAGLPEPSLAADTPLGGASSVLPEWVARTADSLGIDVGGASARWMGLAERIRMEAAAAHSQLFGPRSVAAWTRVDDPT